MKRYVITGGPCSGKSTIINELEKKGYPVLHEVAREVLIEDKIHDFIERQLEIFNRQLKKESEEDHTFKFQDRSLIDTCVYTRLYSPVMPKGISDYSHLFKRYDLIFLLDRLPFAQDGVRIEKGDSEAELVHNMLDKYYSSHGYCPIKVPVMELDKRVDFIVEHAKDHMRGDKNV